MKTREKAIRRLVATAIIAMLGLMFLWNLKDYAIDRDNMRFTQENASKIGWTDELVHEYNEAKGNIVTSANPLVRMYYRHNVAMAFITLAIAVITFASVIYMGYIVIFIKRDITRTQKRGRRA